eukprot:GDKK01042880.1.p1 GENE.GDKK01042880.1~~GDKK01042880.1.p1  ORF type:complete len:669 (+),score=177.46 GDKK01042880.1:28-2007(+)
MTEIIGAVGDRCLYENSYGTVRYVGYVDGDPAQHVWYGIEWDEAGRGKNDGSARGKRYFECAPNMGSFVKAHLVVVEKDFMDSVNERYIAPFSEDHDYLITDPKTNKQKKVEFVGSGQAEQFFKHFYRLNYMTLSNSSICRVEKEPLLPLACRHLNLDGNKFTSWAQIVKILRFTPWINTLTLSANPMGPLDWENVAALDASEGAAEPAYITTARETIKEGTRTGQEIAAAEAVLAIQGAVVFPGVKVLTLNWTAMGLIDCLEICSKLFPNVEQVHLANNSTKLDVDSIDLKRLEELAQIASSSSDAPLAKLRLFDLESNRVLRWSFLSLLCAFPSVRSLQLNDCLVPAADSAVMDESYIQERVEYQPIEEAATLDLILRNKPEVLLGLEGEALHRLAKLEELFLEAAPVQTWRTWGELAIAAPKLTSLRTSESLAAADAGRKSRQLTIALFPLLKLLNSSDVSGRERSQAELYFLSLLRDVPGRNSCALCRSADVQLFHSSRLLRIHVEALLPSSQGGLGAAGESSANTAAAAVLAITLDAQEAIGAQVQRRKFLPTTKIAEVKEQVERSFNIKRENCRLHLKEPGAPCLVPITEDERELEYYGVSSGSTLVIEDVSQTEKNEKDFLEKQASKKVTAPSYPVAENGGARLSGGCCKGH